MRVLLVYALLASLSADDASIVAQRIADVERKLPWFWSSSMDGLSDIPYTYEYSRTTEYLDKSGKQSRTPRSIRLEQIPLAVGRTDRCLEENGVSPCSPEIVAALTADTLKSTSPTPEFQAAAIKAKDNRREQRHAFWTDFPRAFRFTQTKPGQIAFAPTGSYRQRQNPDTGLLNKIAGELWYDLETFEITRIEYRILGKGEDVSFRLAKGDTFSITMTALPDRHYLPTHSTVVKQLPKSGSETSRIEFANFRAFSADSAIRFEDSDSQDPR